MTKYLGDFDAATSVRFSFNTQDATGAAITLAGTPVISIYKSGNTTEVTTGVTLTVDYDNRTGLHHVIVDMSADGTFYAAGSDFRAVITTGTVNGISVVGKEVAHWSCRNRGGVASVVGNVGGNVVGSVASVSGAVGSVTGAVGSVTGNVNGSVASVAAGVDLATGAITASKIGTGAFTAAKFHSDYFSAIWAAVWNVASASLVSAGSIGADLVATIAKFAGITSLARALGVIAGKTADAGALAEIQATPAGATYNNLTDSLEAIKDTGFTVSVVIPPAVAVASQDPSVITCIRGDTLTVSLPVMGNITTRTKAVFTAKNSVNDTDAQAVIQIVEGTGLMRFNGSGTVTAGHASLTVTNATTGAVDLVLNASETSLLAIRDLVWDCQVHTVSAISSPISGDLRMSADVTRATS